MTNNMTMDFVNFYPFVELKAIDELIKSIRNDAKTQLNVSHSALKQKTSILNDDEKSRYAEESAYLEEFVSEIDQLAMELGCIALYKIIEIKLKTILTEHFSIDLTKISNSNFSNLEKQYRSHDISLNKINDYKEINTLRLVCNCIKHSGKIDDKLSKSNNSYKKDSQIIITDAAFKIYRKSTEQFLLDLLSIIQK